MVIAIGTINKQVVSAVANLDERTIPKGEVDATGEGMFAVNMMAMGRFDSVDSHQFTNFQHEDLGLVGDAAGGTVTGTGTATLNTVIGICAANSARAA